MSIYIVNFRTMQRGAYKWLESHHNRGYWRLLEMIDPAGSINWRSHNVIRVVDQGREGIHGVTERSNYWIDSDRVRFEARAAKLNAQTLAAGLIRAYAPSIACEVIE